MHFLNQISQQKAYCDAGIIQHIHPNQQLSAELFCVLFLAAGNSSFKIKIIKLTIKLPIL